MKKTWPATAAAWWRLLRTEFLVLGVSLPILYLLMLFGRLWEIEAPSLDVIAQFSSGGDKGELVALVVLTEPLRSGGAPDGRLADPASLRELVKAVARGGALAIGVDLETAAPEYRELRAESFGVPVVWAQEGRYSNRQRLFFPAPVLGGDAAPELLRGLVTFKTDDDGAIRRYRRTFPTPDGVLPVLPWALSRAMPGFSAVEPRLVEDEILINYRGGDRPVGRPVLPAALVRELAAGAGWAEGPLRGRVVLLGADYQGRDEHLTPLGWLTGLEVLAQIVETELRGPVTKVPGRGLVLFCAAANLLLFGALFRRLPRAAGFAGGLALLVLQSLLSSWLVYGRLAQAPYFGLFLVVDWIYKVNQRSLNRWKKALEEAGESCP